MTHPIPDEALNSHIGGSGPTPGAIDPGIARAVSILQAAGVETFESCEGGDGHAFPEPTIRFHGAIAAGWPALAACLDNGLPILALRRVWDVIDHAPTGPYWEITFREKVPHIDEPSGGMN